MTGSELVEPSTTLALTLVTGRGTAEAQRAEVARQLRVLAYNVECNGFTSKTLTDVSFRRVGHLDCRPSSYADAVEYRLDSYTRRHD